MVLSFLEHFHTMRSRAPRTLVSEITGNCKSIWKEVGISEMGEIRTEGAGVSPEYGGL